MSKKSAHITTFELNADNLPPLTDVQQKELDALVSRPASNIDYSEIPPVTDTEGFYRPIKKMTTVRIDAEMFWPGCAPKVRGIKPESTQSYVVRC